MKYSRTCVVGQQLGVAMCLSADAGNIFDSDDLTSKQKTLDVNLRSTMVGAHLAVHDMVRNGTATLSA
jgi:hypothetical protein